MCGPIKPMLTRHVRYFFTFLNDYSRKTWIYFLKRKSEMLNYYKDFKVIIEKQSGYNIRIVRFDQSEEYTSNDFETFCTLQGTRH